MVLLKIKIGFILIFGIIVIEWKYRSNS